MKIVRANYYLYGNSFSCVTTYNGIYWRATMYPRYNIFLKKLPNRVGLGSFLSCRVELNSLRYDDFRKLWSIVFPYENDH